MLVGEGGLYAWTGTADAKKIEDEAGGRPDWQQLLQAMAYQIAKAIGAMATVLCGHIDGIILTGGQARSPILMAEIKKRVCFLGPVLEYPGDEEMQALAAGALRVLRKEEEACWYEKEENR